MLTFIAYEQHGFDGRFYLCEIYRDLDAFRTHLGTEHVKRFVATVAELCANDTATALVQLDEIPLDHH